MHTASSASSPGPRMSPCPPVCEIAWPAKSRRGPARWPSSIARARPQSAPPTSRTVVNPRSSMSRRTWLAREATYVDDQRRRSAKSGVTAVTWT